MASKPSLPKGTRDFSPIEVAKRQYIIQKIKTNFEKFGFQPIETPSFENSETLMGKYGEEGDRLIFKILDSGDYLEKANEDIFLNDEISFSIYISTQNIFREITNYLINKKLYNIEHIDDSVFQNLIKDKEICDELNKKFNEWTTIYVFRDLNLGKLFKNVLIKNQEYILISIIDFIWNLGAGYSEKKISKYLERDLIEANRTNIKKLSLFLKNKLKNETEIIGANSNSVSKLISEKALRYDLTVPFARYVVQHQNDIEFPFKRYQIQPVWRADRPQKGRFREFFQCDADVVGSTSLWQEVELVQLYDAVFFDLGLEGVTIKINNRKILSGIAEVIGASDKLIDFTVALDKLDKVGEDGVKKEMLEKGISEIAIEKVQPLFNFSGTIQEKIQKLSALLSSSIEGMKGVQELQFICKNVTDLGLKTATLDLDVTLARGLNYYTGAIFEVAAPKSVEMGSIGGGGRYDDLTGIFDSKNKMSGVGISFGLDRIYLVIEQLNLFPETVTIAPKALFLNFGEKEAFYCMKAITELRNLGIKVEMYPDNAKVAKQFMHADKRGISFAILVGENEINENKFSLKNLVSGEQEFLNFEELKNRLN